MVVQVYNSLYGPKRIGILYLRTDNHNKGNTVGSCPTKEERAYIAGFLDGDGSIMLQLKKRSDTQNGIRLMATICFYQDSRHHKPLLWMKRMLGIGYISHRNDGITELRINGFATVRRILIMLSPYLRFKKIQAITVSRACMLLEKKTLKHLTVNEKRKICGYALCVQNQNYKTHKKKTLAEFYQNIGLTP